MTSAELVAKTIRGENNTGRTPKYGWVKFELEEPIREKYGSVRNFEDEFRFDLAHIFGGPFPFNLEEVARIREREGEFTPEMVTDRCWNDVNDPEKWKDVIQELDFYGKQRQRFTYLQSYSMFEPGSALFGFENQLLYMAMYPREMKAFYDRMSDWAVQFANNAMDLGVDMVHLSDDWGSQRSLIFSQQMFEDYFAENLKKIADTVKKRKVFLSLHSDGYIEPVVPYLIECGFDVLHPWQENTGMPLEHYVAKYSDKIGIMGGICVQSTFGFGKIDFLRSEIERVFRTLKGKRWICCTSHFVESTCSMEELEFGFRLIRELAERPF